MEIKDWLGSADNVTAFVVASVIIAGLLRGVFRKTIGARRDLRARLNALSCYNPTDYVEANFGPSVSRKSVAKLIEKAAEVDSDDMAMESMEQRVYATKYGWLTVYFFEDAVAAYAFTLTNKRFRYDLKTQTFGILRGELGRTTFHGYSNSVPQDGELFIGANLHGYTETNYLGRPGRYQAYSLSATMSGWSNEQGSYIDIGSVSWGQYRSQHATENEIVEKREAVERYRETATPDTFAVFGERFRFSKLTGPFASGSIDHDRLLLLRRGHP